MLNTAAALLHMGLTLKAIASTNEQRPGSICLLLNQIYMFAVTQINLFGSSRQEVIHGSFASINNFLAIALLFFIHQIMIKTSQLPTDPILERRLVSPVKNQKLEMY